MLVELELIGSTRDSFFVIIINKCFKREVPTTCVLKKKKKKKKNKQTNKQTKKKHNPHVGEHKTNTKLITVKNKKAALKPKPNSR